MDLFEKTISSEILYEGKVFKLDRLKILLPNGETAQRDVIRHNGGVGIIAVKEDGKILFVEQFRKAIDKKIFEIPAGKLELGEDPKECALRELEEETGYKARKIEFLGKIVMAPGFADEYIHLFYANDLYKGIKGGDRDEFINLYEFDLNEVNQMILNGEIFDSKTISGMKFLENIFNKK